MRLREIEIRYHRNGEAIAPAGTQISVHEQVVEIFSYLQSEAKEKLVCLSLNTKNRILCFEIVSIGTLSASLAHPREVFRSAIVNNAAAIILVHNHPSGDPTPSREDVEVTKQLVRAGQILGIEVLDHVIIGDGTHTSLKERGCF